MFPHSAFIRSKLIKFCASRLVGELANISADLPTAALAGTSMLKALTGSGS